MKIRVECNSGHKADERPVKFWMEDTVLFIESILDRWNSTETQYFRVRADDGNTYVLGHHEENPKSTMGALSAVRDVTAQSEYSTDSMQMIICDAC